ncbi:MAG: hypothetical protein ACXVCP_05485 [Bdellovibrio sp.]
MVYLVFIFFTACFSLNAWSQISQEKCGDFNYANRFGPIRDQDGHGYCHSFASSALVEEYLCKKDPANCGKSVSPIDISRCNFILMDGEKGTNTGTSLDCAINKGGVCFEDLAPYDSVRDLKCSLWDIYSKDGVKCKNKKLAGLFAQWKKTCSDNKDVQNKKNIENLRNSLISSLKEMVPEELLTGKNISDIFATSSSENDFIKQLLISKKCEEKRNVVNAKVEELNSFSSNLDNKILQNTIANFVAKGLRENSSVAISLDLGRTGFYSYAEKSWHSLVVTGMRYNEWTNKCEFQLRNSFGEGAQFNGWYPVENIQNAIRSARYLSEK